ncbi:MAG: hypothetical protein ACXVZW_10195, partial [Gaiellaceae bacterium]
VSPAPDLLLEFGERQTEPVARLRVLEVDVLARVRLREPKSRETLKKVLRPGQEIPQGLGRV